MNRYHDAARLLVLGLSLNLLVAGSACAQDAGTTANTAIVPAPRDGSAMELHQKFLARAEQGEIDLLFLGDSITQGWNDNAVWKRYYGNRNAANFGIGGDRTQHVLWRLANGEIAGISPRLVVLMIGTNNIGQNSPEEIAEGVRTIVETLKSGLPETRILLLGVFPRGVTRTAGLEEDGQDPRVAQVNELIAPLGETERVTYLDIGESFLDEAGNIPRDLMPDFLHLSQRGYRVWAESIEPTVWMLMEPNSP